MDTDQPGSPFTTKLASPRVESLDFSLVLGGPLFQLLRRTHLTDDSLLLARRRVIAISLLAWLPLAVLSALDGEFLAGSAAVPFLMDVDLHVRLLVAMPLLIGAELVVHHRLRTVMRTFRDRMLVPDAAEPELEAAVSSAFRLRNSLTAELLLIAFVYLVGVAIVWRQYVALEAATWYAIPTADGYTLTLAGMWYGFVSLPLFQFLLLRWYFRIFVWARLLWQVSRIKLSLLPTHPDRLGGLGFLAETVRGFVPLLMAHGALLAGQIANQIIHFGSSLPEYKLEILLLVVVLLFVVMGPLLVFAPQLAEARRLGLREYGTLAQRYVRDFDAKWLRGGARNEESLLGSADLQSLADLGTSFGVIQTMRNAPISRESIFILVVATVAPIAPLLLTLMPLEELLGKLLLLVF
jgi:hypothetical protein